MKALRIVIILFITIFFSCSGTKDFSKLKSKDILITLQKGACYGKCSVYKLDIYKNNFAVYTGTANTDKLGVHSKMLRKEEVKAIKEKFKAIGFQEMQDVYPSDIIDFPLISIFYSGGKKPKTVTGRNDRPESLRQLQVDLEKIANSPGWKLEVKPETKAEPEIENMPEVQIDSEIIIEPANNTHLPRWLKKYESYGVYLIKKIAPNLNYWLISWDTSLMRPTDFLELIRQDAEISKAEFNKVISPREH